MWVYLVALAAGVWVTLKFVGRERAAPDPGPEPNRRPVRQSSVRSEHHGACSRRSSYWSDDEEPFSEADMLRMSIEDDIDRGLAGPGEYADLAMLDEEDDYE